MNAAVYVSEKSGRTRSCIHILVPFIRLELSAGTGSIHIYILRTEITTIPQTVVFAALRLEVLSCMALEVRGLPVTVNLSKCE